MAIQQRNLEQLQAVAIIPPTQIDTNNTDTTGINLSAIDGDALFVLNYTAGGSAKIIKVKLQHAATVSGDYDDVPGGAFTNLGNEAGIQKLAIPREELRQFFRLRFFDMTTGYDSYVSCAVLGAARYAV